MNAHADMLIVVGHNELNTYQGAFIALLFRVCENLPDFRNSKTSANKRLLLCLLPSASNVRRPSAQVYGDKITLFILHVQKILPSITLL